MVKKTKAGKYISEEEYETHFKNALSNFGGLSDEDLELRCFSCKHFIEGNACKAFPDGIPLDIIADEIIHNKVHPDQKGDFIYEPKS